MQRHAAIARSWVEEGRTAAVVRVIDAAGLGPRPTEELLLVDEAGTTDGSLLGGALDDVVTAAALEPPGHAGPPCRASVVRRG